jgi:uncharacterized membrane protein
MNMETKPPYTKAQNISRIALGAMLVTAGIGHLTFARKEFQAQVPDWVPVDKDTTVLLSGVAEILLGASIAGLKKERVQTGIVAASFFAAVFPGNIAQYKNHRSAFGLDTDNKRLARLFFQPVLIGWALFGSGALNKRKGNGQ